MPAFAEKRPTVRDTISTVGLLMVNMFRIGWNAIEIIKQINPIGIFLRL
jgi:hypothetical protein